MTARLAADDLAIGYQGKAFREHIALSVGAGEIVAIIGSSGSGKSTLLSTLVGAVAPMAGRVLVDGADVTNMPIHERGIGIIFQQALLFPHLDAADNIGYGLRRHGVGRRQARDEAVQLLEWVGMGGYAPRRVDEMSGGQAQRVALARALAPRPSALLLDEPFSALDADLRQRLVEDVGALLRERQIAAIHVTHDRAEAAEIADRVVRLEELGEPAPC